MPKKIHKNKFYPDKINYTIYYNVYLEPTRATVIPAGMFKFNPFNILASGLEG